MVNKLDLHAELSLDLINVLFDVVFTLILGTQTESLHAPNRFIDNQQQIFASADRDFFHGLQKSKWISSKVS